MNGCDDGELLFVYADYFDGNQILIWITFKFDANAV